MSNVDKIKNNPKFQQLVKTRNRFAVILAILVWISYYGYVGLIAFDKELLAMRLGEGVMTLGIPVGFGLIIFTVVITWIYVRRANGEFDRKTKELIEEIKS